MKNAFLAIVVLTCLSFPFFVRAQPVSELPMYDRPGIPTDREQGTYQLWLPGSDGQFSYSLDSTNYMNSARSTGAHRLHEIGITGQGVTAAIVNSGFYTDHELLAGKIVNNYTGPEEPHGTHVAGTILGMAPNAALWLDTFRQTSEENAAVFDRIAADTEKYNIAVVNNSWGDNVEGWYANPQEVAESWPETVAAVENLLAHGVAVVASSGNNGINDRMSYPEGLPGVLAVGALNPYGSIQYFSTLHDQSNRFILAPGVDIYSSAETSNGDSYYVNFSGTSMAAPHASGAIALLQSGARNATPKEITDSIYDSGDPVPYDGNAIIERKFVDDIPYDSPAPDPRAIKNRLGNLISDADIGEYVAWLDEMIPKYDADEVTADEWRLLRHVGIYASYTAQYFGNTQSMFVDIMTNTGGLQPLEFVEYRFLRVDKAFMDLTHKRTDKIADRIDIVDSGLSGIMYAYADELGADINGHAAQVFQRLDALDPAGQFVAARQMSPRFANAAAESAHFGIVGLHRSFGRRTETNRLGQGSNASSCNPCGQTNACAPCSPCDNSGAETIGWVEGFGGGFDRQYSIGSGGYDGSFAGTSFGLERKRRNLSYGIFGNWSNHRVKGDGVADGDWGSFGAYGRIDRRRGFLEGSIAGSFGDYDMTRNIAIPGVVFTGNQPGTDVFDWAPNMFEQARSKFDTQSVSFRLAGGRDLWKRKGWVVGPRAELSLSYIEFDPYTEDGAESLNLHVNRYQSSYLEGGVGLFAGKCFLMNRQKFVATGKLMGMAGGVMGGDLYGNFVNNGSAFQVDPNHTTTGWIVPEATVAWNLRDGVVLSGSYAGRFGEKYGENNGSLALSLYW